MHKETIKPCPVPSCGSKAEWLYGDCKVSCTICLMSVGGYEKGDSEPDLKEVVSLWNSLPRNELASVEGETSNQCNCECCQVNRPAAERLFEYIKIYNDISQLLVSKNFWVDLDHCGSHDDLVILVEDVAYLLLFSCDYCGVRADLRHRITENIMTGVKVSMDNCCAECFYKAKESQ